RLGRLRLPPSRLHAPAVGGARAPPAVGRAEPADQHHPPARAGREGAGDHRRAARDREGRAGALSTPPGTPKAPVPVDPGTGAFVVTPARASGQPSGASLERPARPLRTDSGAGLTATTNSSP